jgi:hypothetical protein
MKNSLLAILLLAAVFTCGCCACCRDIPTITPTPVPTLSPDDPGIILPSDPSPDAVEEEESRKVILAAANAIIDNDKEAFLSLLSNSTRADYEKDLDLSTPGALVIAEALKNAGLVDGYEDFFIYEITVDDSKYTFYTVKENGVWKIEGL